MKRGMTLIELLVSIALTMLLLLAMAQFFAYVGDTVRDGRAIVEMGGNIRGAVQQLRTDLQSLTAKATPIADPVSGHGFFEYVEGTAWDADINADGTQDIGTMQGDIDDILSFTIRSGGLPFTGSRYDPASGQTVEVSSPYAEVVWFTTFDDANGNGTWDVDEQRFLARRQLLIYPNVEAGTPGPDEEFFQHNDISAHYDRVNSRWVPNSLQSLANRENRFIHQNLVTLAQNGLRAADATQPQAFMPNPLQLEVGNIASLQRYTLQGAKEGEDLTLPNLLAFDVRGYDPEATMYPDSDGESALQPGDPGFSAAVGLPMAQPVGWGCYVDLYYNRYLTPPQSSSFAGASSDATLYYTTWETWSNQYERDGLDQKADGAIDTATDGLDNPPSVNGVDDATEFETRPPYAKRLTGIQVRIRMYEPGTRQTRQATVVGALVE